MPALSVTIITFNEVTRLEDAIRSVAWADEILVLDSGSTDGTIDLARRLATRVEVTDWPGYAAQKNRAATLARTTGFSRSTPTSASDPSSQPHSKRGRQATLRGRLPLPRVSKYLGRWIRTTDWYPDWQLRLYDRRRARWTERRVHESVQADGPVGRLTGELQHLPYRDVATTSNDRSLHDARGSRHESPRQPGSVHGARDAAVAAFLRNYLLRRGILDGRVGLAYRC